MVYGRYDKTRKLDRNKLLREFAASHPWLSLAQVGAIFGITKQRVFILLKGDKPFGKN